jgi:glycosyltransferase involved in cell wall biosynthesis
MKKLCLNMIVRNEVANIERCLASVSGHIACWVIGDTGSDDGTQDIIRSFFEKRGIPGELHSFPFNNFEQARNAALDAAYTSLLEFDYLLLCDADMELVVEDQGFRASLSAPSYQVLQRPGGMSYWNTRLVDRMAGARYRGVTHEYLDAPGTGQKLQGVWYKDHATGSNRPHKFERDIRLLTEALEKNPSSSRELFYLAQSYRDVGRTLEAAVTYAKRAEMGGWEEEAWYARWQHARCLRALGDECGFLRTSLAAFNQRPWRAEPLYDLAKFHRERGMHDVSVLFSEPGLAVRQRDDILFVDEHIHGVGLKEEYAISAFYSREPARKERGHAMCDWLALAPTVPRPSRDLARSNLFFYTEPAGAIMPSLAPLFGDIPRGTFRTLGLDLPVATDTFDQDVLATPFDGGLLMLIHETEWRDNTSYDWHRFALFDHQGRLSRISRRLFFSDKGRERTLGLIQHGQQIAIGFLGGDAVAKGAKVNVRDVEAILTSPLTPARISAG